MPSKRYHALSAHLKSVFGGPVRKVTFRAGLSCPNRDGTLGTGGCVFCSGRELVPAHHRPGHGIREQIELGIAAHPRNAKGFIAYLQDHTGTHCAPERLDRILDEAAGVEGVCGLSVGTRPDCLGRDILDVLSRAARRLPLWVEIGLQTSSDRTLAAINRNHSAVDFAAAARAVRDRGMRTVAHVVLGLPGEGPDETAATADFLASAGVDGVKLHNILVIEGTPLHDMYRRGQFAPPGMREYCAMAADFIERLPAKTVVHRLAAEAPPSMLAAPSWAKSKARVGAAVEAELEARDSFQGKRHDGPAAGPGASWCAAACV